MPDAAFDFRVRVPKPAAAPLGPDRCPSCGRTAVVRIEWDRGGQERAMRLMAQIKRIERGARPAGGCAVCRGEGPLPPIFVLYEDEPLPPLPACTACGKQFSGPFRVIRRPVLDADGAER